LIANVSNIGKIKKGNNCSYILNSSQTTIIRVKTVNYLNATELILNSAYIGIADEDIIKKQFRSLVSKEKNKYLLENFRKVCGGATAYPYCAKFVADITTPTDEIKNKLGK
jgi:hypothetical protein